jgi:hypothetical protein
VHPDQHHNLFLALKAFLTVSVGREKMEPQVSSFLFLWLSLVGNFLDEWPTKLSSLGFVALTF